MSNNQSKIRVIMTIMGFHPLVGGAEKQLLQLAPLLIEKGVDVTVATARLPGLPSKEVICGIPVERHFSLRGRRFLGRPAKFAYILGLLYHLTKMRKRYDIIHAHVGWENAFASVFAGRILKIPVVVKIAGSGYTLDVNVLKKRLLLGSMMGKIIKRADAFICLSDEMMDEMVQWGVESSKCVVITNGVAYSNKKDINLELRRDMGFDTDDKIVVNVARFRPEKNQPLLLKAWKEVIKVAPNSKLLLVGSNGEYWNYCKELAAQLEICETVIFAGEVSNVDDYLSISNLFVLPSKAEGVSNALLEAMAAGLPCIASDVAGNRKVIGTNEIGMLFTLDSSVNSLADCLIWCLKSPERCKEMGAAAYKHICDNFSIQFTVDKILHLYENLV